MARELVSSFVHRVLLTAAGLVSVAGVVGMNSAPVSAGGGAKCKTGAVCFVGETKGNCNENVTDNVCCCEAEKSCPEYDKCNQPPV
jgi:hypothetical protein